MPNSLKTAGNCFITGREFTQMSEFVTQVLEQDHNQQAFGTLLPQVQETFLLTLGFDVAQDESKSLKNTISIEMKKEIIMLFKN